MSSPAERYAASRRRAAEQRTRLATFARELEFELDDFQREACAALEGGRGVLVAAPTGAGKTVVGEFAVHLALEQGRKAFYTTPIKALSNQKYGDLVRRHGVDDVGLLTGDTTVNGDAPVVVMTTEVLRNMLYAGSPALEGLAYVVMDEVHYLADRFRGPVWEEVIIHLPDDVQLVSLSATVSNAEEFGDWLTMVRGDTAVVVSEVRPVPLWQHVMTRDGLFDLYAGHVDPTAPGVDPPINPDLAQTLRRLERAEGPHRGGAGDRGFRGRGGRRVATGLRRPAPRFAVVDVLDREALLPAIFFVFSRAGCDAAVQQCVRAGLRLTTAEQEAEIRRVVEQRCAAVPAQDLAVLGFWEWSQALERGIASHHAGLLPLFKETVEELFSRGLVKVVFATETLALGINMPARSVVLDKLTKWDGSAHVDITPGEYTQLTGRAGRRGIDVEGHAVVVDHGALDPTALAGLASRRTYPLRSSFRPTYNMAVNLVAQVGRERAREVLETSFAQFQADRAVVGLARQAQAHAEALDGYAEAMRCHLGDFAEYARLRRQLTEREQDLSREAARARRAEALASLQRLRVGDVVEIPAGRRAGYAVVLDPGRDAGLDGPRPTVLTSERQVRTLSATDLDRGVRTVTTVRVPRQFSPRNAAHKRDLASAMRSALADPGRGAHGDRTGREVRPAADDATLAGLRRRLRSHPCHGCSEREDHARWAERYHRLKREHDALVRRIEGRTSSIARVFDRICDVLTVSGYLEEVDDEAGPRLRVTDSGRWLRRLYAESDLLVAECLRRGVWDGLDAPGLAAVVSTVVFEARREERETAPQVPGGPQGRLGRAIDETVRIWSHVEDLELAHRLQTTRPVDTGLVEPVHRWASGRSLGAVLQGTDLAAGDFVRWCKQVIDLLDQIGQAAPTPATRAAARRAVDQLRRGVVAYSSV
ncbi:DEAD/DEAH box helicase [Cellulomonas carbonis]|uniref:RNA helicase n=1 Tax=Cellulomonas carbonis T26 TaxID=947969 RepID=A0A0A0BTL2_9CELL|nr:DEAD/DEAH box helicase [Cellulomonas carbonis]KGM11723.1 RNA helicase [Cellulomonas carbonis T26]GGB94471.1 helicase [Cellulomonas carbonis]